jgi:hypothetical protein
MKIGIALIGLSLFIFGYLGIAYAQKEQGQNIPAGEQSSTESPSYMGGKEHYLPNSPTYMSGKKHYLPDRSIPKPEKPSQDSEASASKEEIAPDESQNLEDQERFPFRIELRENPDNSDIY